MRHAIREGSWRSWQRVTNQHWPAKYEAARSQDRPDAIAVHVLVIFDEDGPVWLEGVATYWVRDHVKVRLDDRRVRALYVWVRAKDVRRR